MLDRSHPDAWVPSPSDADDDPSLLPRRRDIQGLRALAVALVVGDHVFGWPFSGYVGVDVFFVISGYLITEILLRERETHGTFSLVDFYRRRIKRLVPAAFLVLAVTAGLSYGLLSPDRLDSLWREAVAAVFFASNLESAAAGTDYFAQGAPPSPLQHYWSLAVEMQFYVVWPLVVLLVLSLHSRSSRSRGRVAVGAVAAALVVCSFAWGIHAVAASPATAYFSTLTRVWELGVGVLVACWVRRVPAVGARLLGALGLAAILLAAFVVPDDGGFPVPWALLPTLGAALVLLADGVGPSRAVLANPVASYVGDLSYSLYLWHLPVLVLGAVIVDTAAWPVQCAVVGVTVVLSVATYHLVERPLQVRPWFLERRTGPGWVPAGGWRYAVLVGALSAAMGLIVSSTDPTLQEPPSVSPFAEVEAEALDEQCVGAAVLAPDSGCELNDARPIYPTPATLRDDVQGAFSCWADAGDPMRVCSYGPDGPDVTSVALVGDSHAAMLIPGLLRQLERVDWRLDTYVGWGCQWTTAHAEECDRAMPDIDESIRAGGYDLVIVTAARDKTATDKEWFAEQYAATWEPVVAAGASVVVVGDNPRVSEEAMSCVARRGFDPVEDPCPTPRDAALGEVDPLPAAADLVDGTVYIDTARWFCLDDSCPAVIGNIAVYRDTASHITATYSRSLAPLLVDAILAAVEVRQ